MKTFDKGINCIIDKDVILGDNIHLGHNCIIEKNVILGDRVFIDNNVIVRNGTTIGDDSFIGANCIIGECVIDRHFSFDIKNQSLSIGKEALIRSGTIIYSGSDIGNNFNTGHNVTIREKSIIGNNVSVGTYSDIQGNCKIGNYVRMHSNVHVGQFSVIDDFVWIYPYSVLTNDPTPPSDHFVGTHIHSFAVVATSSIILPGLEIEQDSLVAAGSVVTKNVESYSVVAGNPSKKIGDVRDIKNKISGDYVYPWREHFNKYMPWEGLGFEDWYNNIDKETKEKYGISKII